MLACSDFQAKAGPEKVSFQVFIYGRSFLAETGHKGFTLVIKGGSQTSCHKIKEHCFPPHRLDHLTEVPCSALGPPTSDKHGPVGVGPGEGHEEDQRTGAPLLSRKAERCGGVPPGEGRPYCSLSVAKGDLQERWRGTVHKSV